MGTAIQCLGLLLIASSALATPEVGDYVKFTKIFKFPDGQVSKSKMSQEILSYNSKTDEFEVRIIETYEDGSIENTEFTWPKELFESDEKIEYIISNCEDQGGDIENIKIGEENLKSCRIETNFDGERMSEWHAHVPFGLAGYSSKIRYGRELTATAVEMSRGGGRLRQQSR